MCYITYYLLRHEHILAGAVMKTVSSTVGVLLAEAKKLEATCDEPMHTEE